MVKWGWEKGGEVANAIEGKERKVVNQTDFLS
jgi:hypothetical protein